MFGASDIKELTARFTNNEALQEQLATELSDIKLRYDQTQNAQLFATNRAYDLNNLADEWSMIATTCESEANAIDAERDATIAELKEKCTKDVDEEGLRYIRETKIGLREFVDEGGMCGMGMGMGSLGCETAIELTVQELMALRNGTTACGEPLIKKIDPDSQETYESNFNCVAEALNKAYAEYPEDKRPTATVGCEGGKQYIEIKRPGEKESTKIFDANGNGALDDQDYSFECAFEEAVAKYNLAMVDKNTESQQQIRANYEALILAADQAADTLIADLQEKQAAAEMQSKQNREEAAGQTKTAESLNPEIEGLEEQGEALEEKLADAEEAGAVIEGQMKQTNGTEDTDEDTSVGVEGVDPVEEKNSTPEPVFA